MPVYEYRCDACGKDFERYLATAATAVACPTCASGDIKRKLSVVRFRNDGTVATAAMPAGGGCCGGGCGCH
jgi:putative FmdB family regulatory protein